jgi:hypothetical protein
MNARHVALALIASGIGTAACLHDFGTFDGPPPSETPDAADASLGSPVDGSSGTGTDPDANTPPDAGCSSAPTDCLDKRTACRSTCDTSATTCLGSCPDAGSKKATCEQSCRDTSNACNGTCNLTCITCSGACYTGCL